MDATLPETDRPRYLPPGVRERTAGVGALPIGQSLSRVSEDSTHRVSGAISTGIQTSKVKSPFPAVLLWAAILGASPLPGRRTLGAPVRHLAEAHFFTLVSQVGRRVSHPSKESGMKGSTHFQLCAQLWVRGYHMPSHSRWRRRMAYTAARRPRGLGFKAAAYANTQEVRAV